LADVQSRSNGLGNSDISSNTAPQLSFGVSAYKTEDSFETWLLRCQLALQSATAAGGKQTVSLD
jgi:hypothetical protein